MAYVGTYRSLLGRKFLGPYPALRLDFLTSTALPSTITFSRGTQATLTDSTGKITYAPNNLLTNSESFEASSWLKSRATITSNSLAAPNGTSTADTLVEDTSTGDHVAYQTLTFVAGVNYIMTVYAKANTRTRLNIVCVTGLLVQANFDLSAGTVISTISGTASISDAGNGWYRCVLAGTATSTASGNMQLRLISSGTTTSYTGNGTSGLYIWGAQLEAVTYQTTPSTYVSTTPKNLLGFTQEFDNAAWTKSNSFVQTNLLTYSQDFDNAAWVESTTATVSANATAAPDGTTTADKLVATATSGFHYAYNASVTYSATSYTYTCYVKSAEYTQCILSNLATGTFAASFDLSTGTPIATYGANVLSSAITSVGNGWFRCSVTFTGSTGAVVSVIGYPAGATLSATGASYTGDGISGVFVWGAQVVQGATAGNYQPTYAAAAAVQYAAPDGTLSADKLVENTAAAEHAAFQTATGISGTTYTYSVYAKAGERSWLIINAYAGASARNYFDLTNGVTGTAASGCTTSITSVGNGWYRCAVTRSAGGTALEIDVQTSTGNNTFSYTGDGTSGIYIWGAQLSNSASLDPYVYNPVAAPTSAAYYGPRFDYDPVTLAAKGLLIEEARTNWALYSAQFDNASWTKLNASVTANAVSAPDGTVSADLVVPDTSNNQHGVYYGATATAGTTYTHTVYAKAGGYNWLYMTEGNNVTAQASFNLATGVLGTVTGTGSPTATITAVGNGWYRCSLTLTPIANLQNIQFRPNIGNGGGAFAGDGTSGIYLWGAQLEAGAFATSYIPTVASTVTRSADVATMTGGNFSAWYNQAQGTFVVGADAFINTVSSTYGSMSVTDGGSQNYINTCIYNGQWGGGSRVSNVIQTDFLYASSYTPNVPTKTATAYAVNDSALSLNGATPLTDTSCSLPTVSQLNIGGFSTARLNGHIRSIAYYNVRLPNSTLQSLTS